MIEGIVKQWDARKSVLRDWLSTKHPDSYEELVRELVGRVLTEGVDHYHGPLTGERIHRIDDGPYQGTEIYLIATDTYQPGASDYIWFDNYYGSCSGCDTLQSISNYDDGPPTEAQVNKYMDLALHMVQRMKWLREDA